MTAPVAPGPGRRARGVARPSSSRGGQAVRAARPRGDGAATASTSPSTAASSSASSARAAAGSRRSCGWSAGCSTPTRGTVTIAGDTAARAREGKQFGLVPQTPGAAAVAHRAPERPAAHRGEPGRRGPRHARGPTRPRRCSTRSVSATSSTPTRASCPAACSSACSLVRAFALGAPILLMDEPFAALDEITRGGHALPPPAAVGAHRHHRRVRHPPHPRGGRCCPTACW